VHATWHVACFGISDVVWKDLQPPYRSPPAPRLFLSHLLLRTHARHGYGARGERGTRTERGASEERARSAIGRHQLGVHGAGREAQHKRARVGGTSYPQGHGAGREAQRKRARAQEGARQEGASTGGREHRRRKLRGVRVSELPKEPANNPQSLRVKPPKSRNSYSFAGPFAGYCNSFYDKCVDQPANDLQTTLKRKFRFAKCGNYRHRHYFFCNTSATALCCLKTNISLRPYAFFQVTDPRNVLFSNVAQPVTRATVSAVVCPTCRDIAQAVGFFINTSLKK
jgi:hypothetical protein